MGESGARHEAVVMRHGRVSEVGTSREMLNAAGADAVRVDLQGRTVLPGFIETHAHPGMFGQRLRDPIDPSSPANRTQRPPAGDVVGAD